MPDSIRCSAGGSSAGRVGTITFLTSRENRTVAREVLGGIAMARRPAERALRQLEGEMRRRVESGAEGTLFRPARGVDGEGIWIDQRRRVLLEKAESVVLLRRNLASGLQIFLVTFSREAAPPPSHRTAGDPSAVRPNVGRWSACAIYHGGLEAGALNILPMEEDVPGAWSEWIEGPSASRCRIKTDRSADPSVAGMVGRP